MQGIIGIDNSIGNKTTRSEFEQIVLFYFAGKLIGRWREREYTKNVRGSVGESIRNFIMEHEEKTFSEKLLSLIKARRKTNPAIYKKIGITKQHFSKIKNDP